MHQGFRTSCIGTSVACGSINPKWSTIKLESLERNALIAQPIHANQCLNHYIKHIIHQALFRPTACKPLPLAITLPTLRRLGLSWAAPSNQANYPKRKWPRGRFLRLASSARLSLSTPTSTPASSASRLCPLGAKVSPRTCRATADPAAPGPHVPVRALTHGLHDP